MTPNYTQEWVGGLSVGVNEDVGRQFAELVRSAVILVPDRMRARLHAAGVYLWVARRLRDSYPANDSPRGYAEGSTWDHASAVYHTTAKCAIVAEEYLVGERWVPDGSCYPWPLLHEMGHAVDAEMGAPSSDPAFRALWDLERARAEILWPAPCADPHRLATFVAAGDGGPEEVFAEGCVAAWCPGLPWQHWTREAFPRSLRWVSEWLARSDCPAAVLDGSGGWQGEDGG